MKRDTEVEFKISVANETAEDLTLVIEPIGEIYLVKPGTRQALVYRGCPQPNLTISHHGQEIKIWDEGPGLYEVLDGNPRAT